MERDILLDIGVGEIRLAVLEDGILSEMYVERHENAARAGDIYRAKVERVLPGMQAAFVNIGLDKNAFLYVRDALPVNLDENGNPIKSKNVMPQIETLVKAGQELTVQIIKEQTGDKGPRISTKLTLPGHLSILMTDSPSFGISKKIDNHDERVRLREIGNRYRPENTGMIIRTAALGATEEHLSEDIKRQTDLLKQIRKLEQKGTVPRCLHHEPGIIEHAIREYLTPQTHRFIINDRSVFEQVREQTLIRAPELLPTLAHFGKEYDMFSYYNVSSMLEEALSRKVWLKSGGYLVIDYTEALTVIDVNSGKYVGKSTLEDTAVLTNCEAATAIARQIRLRDLSGIVIIDFIDMHTDEHRNIVLQALKDALVIDRTQTVVVGMTGLGLVEMTRKKIRQPLHIGLTSPCKCCKGSGRVRQVLPSE